MSYIHSSLRRKAPMKRTSILRKTPLRKVSKKREAENQKYLRQRTIFLAKYPHCQCCISEFRKYPSTDVHHMNKRNGARLLDEDYWMAVCRGHHDWIHANPSEARRLGWLI